MAQPLRVLLVEDSEDDAELLQRELKRSGFDPLSERVETAAAMRAALERAEWDVVLSDYHLPAFSALEALALLQQKQIDIPFIIISGQVGEDRAVEAMRKGAHDYLMKESCARLGPCIERELREAENRRLQRESAWALQESNRQLEAAFVELNAAQNRLIGQEKLRALGQMASGIAHDFNNSLSPILGFSELLLARPDYLADPARVEEYLRLIHSTARDAAGVVGRLRKFYRKQEEDDGLLPVDLRVVVDQAVELTQFGWKDQARMHGVNIRVLTDVPELPVILADEGQLREALANLILNAIEAMPNGGTIRISARTKAGYDGIPGLVLSVSDTGEGMSPELCQMCWEPFVTTKGGHGTGLGLSIVHGIVQRHAGSIQVASQPGQGSCFEIWLPLCSNTAVESPKSEGTKAFPRSLRILAVEDEDHIARLLREFLALDGHRCVWATDGTEGLHMALREPFDLAITDRSMPHMSGDEFALQLKRQCPHVPILMLTGFGDLMRLTTGAPEGVDLVIGKPFSLESLRRGIQALLGGSA